MLDDRLIGVSAMKASYGVAGILYKMSRPTRLSDLFRPTSESLD